MDSPIESFVVLAANGTPITVHHAYDETTNFSAPDTTTRSINNFWSRGNAFHSDRISQFLAFPMPSLSRSAPNAQKTLENT